MLSDQYAATTASINNSAPDNSCRGAGNTKIFVKNTAASNNVTTFTGLVANAKFLIKLAAPAVSAVAMSSDLSGIYGYLTLTGSGMLTVRYAADLKTYIDNAIANALNA